MVRFKISSGYLETCLKSATATSFFLYIVYYVLPRIMKYLFNDVRVNLGFQKSILFPSAVVGNCDILFIYGF